MQTVESRGQNDLPSGQTGRPAVKSSPEDNGQPRPTPALVVEGVWAGYDHHPILEDITFQMAEGAILGIIGPNGAGKSTLLKAVLGMVETWRGRILVLGHGITQSRRRVGYMPQVEQVDWDFPVTVGDVALMGRYARRGLFRRTTGEDRQAAVAALERVGIFQLRNQLIGELSGGQRRRALLARALTNEPDLLLLDEPMAGLDAKSQHQLLDIIDQLRAEGASVVLSTHDLSCVSSRCDQVVCLNRRLVAFGSPREILNEEVLGETFGTHLLLVHLDGQAYAYQHHSHEAVPVAGPAHEEGEHR